jgi:hypothetical protein
MSDVEIATMLGFSRILLADGVPGGVLEVRAHKGRTTKAFRLDAHIHDRVVVVDTFDDALSPNEDVFDTFARNVSPGDAWIEIRRGAVRRELPKLRADGYVFRLIVLDADHAEVEAHAELVDAWALLSVGGYLFVGNVCLDTVSAAIQRFLSADQGPRSDVATGNVNHRMAFMKKLSA